MKRLRKKGFYDYSWKSDPNAVYIGRPSKWGNPFKLKDYPLEACLEKYKEYLNAKLKEDSHFLDPLKRKNLVCFCPLDQPCHADIIMKVLEKEEERREWMVYYTYNPKWGYGLFTKKEAKAMMDNLRKKNNGVAMKRVTQGAKEAKSGIGN